MRYCNRPFQHIYVFPNGDVRSCSWTYECIGNILEQSLEEIWVGDKVEQIRKTIRDGSYSLCNHLACPYLANNSLPDIDEKEFEHYSNSSEYPTEINAAYDYICNNACPSCRHEIFKPDEKYKQNMKIISDKLIPAINKTDILSTDGNGDCFASPYIMDMLENIQPLNPELEILLESNGVLCNEENWSKLEHLYKYNINIVITPNSFESNTYKNLSGGFDSVDKVIANLHFIRKLRKSGQISKFDISIVVQDRNYKELPEFTRRCIEEFECDQVIIKPIFYWFALTQEEYWFKDILNPLHPYFNDYMEVLKDPILKDPKVYFWGGDKIHEPTEHPATNHKKYFDSLHKFLKMKNPIKEIEQRLMSKDYKNIAIYGVNEYAEIICRLLQDSSINVVGFVDKYAKVDTFCELPVFKFECFDPDMTDTIIVSNFVYYENIARDLKFHNFKGNIVSFDSL